MSEVANKPQIKPNQAFVMGLIDFVGEGSREGKKVFRHRFILPAIDQFSSPSKVIVEAAARLGRPGEEASAHVYLAGIGRFFDSKDGERVQTADMWLRAVE